MSTNTLPQRIRPTREPVECCWTSGDAIYIGSAWVSPDGATFTKRPGFLSSQEYGAPKFWRRGDFVLVAALMDAGLLDVVATLPTDRSDK